MWILAVGGCSTANESSRSTSTTAAVDPTLDALLAVQLGGNGSTIASNRNAFSLPNRALPGSDRAQFEVGDSFFTQNWISAPASTQSRDGLGPTFNAPACATCHIRDGRAAPPDATMPNRAGLLLRLSVPGEDEHGGPKPDPVYGGQLQDRSVKGVPAEGRMQIDLTEVRGTYDDGTPYTLLAPTYSIADPAFGARDMMISPRIAPGVFGVGLLEAIPDAALEAAADPDDANADGISGRVNYVWNAETESFDVGRFGWKANVSTVSQQTAGAFHGDVGITSALFDESDCPAAQTACAVAASANASEPEVDAETFGAVVFYTRVLAVPDRRPTPTADQGANLFAEAGCASCHSPAQTTGASDIPALANQTIHPYTDLLLHDMGAGLADGRPDFEASGSEWRTAPLWGLGLYDRINNHTRLLHDGRARTIEEAILWHGGEAAAAQAAFVAMPATDRRKLLAFLESL